MKFGLLGGVIEEAKSRALKQVPPLRTVRHLFSILPEGLEECLAELQRHPCRSCGKPGPCRAELVGARRIGDHTDVWCEPCWDSFPVVVVDPAA